MTRFALTCLLLALAPTLAQAALDTSPRALPRPVSNGPAVSIDAQRPDAETPRPLARPGSVVAVTATRSRAALPTIRPLGRPDKRATPAAAVRTQPSGVVSSTSGAICGSRDIVGVRLTPIQGKIQGCGIAEPVRVLSVAGVRLSRPATMDCTTAKTVRNWVEKGARPAVGRLGGGLEELEVAAHYACRTRNHQPGAPISEHGKGRAIDISAVTLSNGFRITVANGWNDEVQGQLLRKLHISACREFKTVLGPDADRFHKDHFHFDTARRGGRAICR